MQVLLVEDEPSIADSVVYALESEGMSCRWVSTGQAALAALDEATPELVLLDIGLPDINGFDLFRRLRERSAAPILFLTARSTEVDQVLGLELGADDYITKPFSPRVLSARVRAHLRRQTPVLPAVASPAATRGFSDDAEAKRIKLHGQLLDLSRYEYRLLSLLIAHPSRVFSRETLMQRVWEAPEESFDRTVDTHIKVLRQKIKAVDPELNPIATHRGLGYSFEPPSS